jgi:hypothetical protein
MVNKSIVETKAYEQFMSFVIWMRLGWIGTWNGDGGENTRSSAACYRIELQITICNADTDTLSKVKVLP